MSCQKKGGGQENLKNFPTEKRLTFEGKKINVNHMLNRILTLI